MSNKLFENSKLRKNLNLKDILDEHTTEEIEQAAQFILSILTPDIDRKTLPDRKKIKQTPKECLTTLWYRRDRLIADNIKDQEKISFREGVEVHELQSKINFPEPAIFSLNPGQALGFAKSQDGMNPPPAHKGVITTAINNMKNLKIRGDGGIPNALTFTPLIVWVLRCDTWDLTFKITKKSHTKFLRLHKKSILSALQIEEPNTVNISTGATQIIFRLSFN